jgi:hypothetical protein
LIATYLGVLAVCGTSLAIGQGAMALCGVRRWSWLSPAVGLALVCAICWGTVRLPGDGVISAIAVSVLALAAVLFLWGRVDGVRDALRIGLPVGLLAAAAASLPFIVEGAFGILGTSFNPDMSQHLLAADRLAEGTDSQLLHQGYPLGPHAVVVALNKGLGIGLVQGFDGLTIAVAVIASLTALAAFSDLPALRRTTGALLVGLPYVVASYFAQGAFKETMQALFVFAFVLALREASRNPEWRELPLRFVPAALIAVGSVYAYSFPGLIWLAGALLIWLLLERKLDARALLLGLTVFAVLVAPELGRMIDFQRFETFDPNGPGLGNLFGQISPLEALGIWPSGDFRLAPGDGAVPAAGYYVGAAFALVLLVHGATCCWRRRETAILAGLAAVTVAYLAARVGGTPYTAAKAIEVAAPLVSLTILLPLLSSPTRRFMRHIDAKGASYALSTLAATAFILAAGTCSVLALANAPVGPTSYSPGLAELRHTANVAPTLVLASEELLDDRHGTPFLAWELRGGRVCIEGADDAGDRPPPGVRFVISEGSSNAPPFPGLRLRRLADPYVLWERTRTVRGSSPCPLIAVRQARQGPSP